MYVAITIIILIVIIEIYPLMAKISTMKEPKKTITGLSIDNKNDVDFSEYKELESFEKNLKPGKIYTKNNHNLFIIKKEEVILMYPDKLYDLKDDFKLRYLKVKDNEILEYYYA